MFLPLIVSWAILACVVAGLAFYRKAIARNEDDYIHVDAVGVNNQQVALARKLEQIDKWGKLLTIVVAVYGVILLGVFLYQGWVTGGTTIVSQ